MKIIAFAGLAKSGKTTAAQAAASRLFKHGYHPHIIQFAGPLKAAADMLGFQKGGETDHLYRKFCQTTGAMARSEAPDWFVNLLAERLDTIGRREHNRIAEDGQWHESIVLIDDLRFANELGLIKRYSGTTIFISADRRLPDMDAEWRTHISEALATEYEAGRSPDETFDFSISNNTKNSVTAFENTAAAMALSLASDAKTL